MKYTIKSLLGLVVILALVFTSAKKSEHVSITTDLEDGITIPQNVKTIIDNKCMGCHKPDSRNKKGKEKLQWVNVSKFNVEDQKKFIDDLEYTIEEGEMPPKKLLVKYPKMKLTKKEKKTFVRWIKSEKKRLRKMK